MAGHEGTVSDVDNHGWMALALSMVRSLTAQFIKKRNSSLIERGYFYCVQAEEAMAAGEVPVGCVFVRNGRVIAKARNRTNELRNVRPTTNMLA